MNANPANTGFSACGPECAASITSASRPEEYRIEEILEGFEVGDELRQHHEPAEHGEHAEHDQHYAIEGGDSCR